MEKVEKAKLKNNPSTYPVGSFVRFYRLPSERERKNPPYWAKYMDCLVGEIGVVINSSSKNVCVVFKKQCSLEQFFIVMLNRWLEPVLDVDPKFQNDLQDSWRRRDIADSFDNYEEKQYRSFYGKTGSLVQVISRAPSVTWTKGVPWNDVKHTMSEYGIVCFGLDDGWTMVAFPKATKDDEKLTYTHFYPGKWLRRASWSDVGNKKQKNQLEDLKAIVVEEKQKKLQSTAEMEYACAFSSPMEEMDESDNSSSDVKQTTLSNGLKLPNWKAEPATEETPGALCCKLCEAYIFNCRLSTGYLICSVCACKVFADGQDICPFTRLKVTSLDPTYL